MRLEEPEPISDPCSDCGAVIVHGFGRHIPPGSLFCDDCTIKMRETKAERIDRARKEMVKDDERPRRY